jgi:hypothetical protein
LLEKEETLSEMKSSNQNHYVVVAAVVAEQNTRTHREHMEHGKRVEHWTGTWPGDKRKQHSVSSVEHEMKAQVEKNLCVHRVQPFVVDRLEREERRGDCPC